MRLLFKNAIAASNWTTGVQWIPLFSLLLLFHHAQQQTREVLVAIRIDN